MADIATNNIADYIKGMGINISALSRGSGVSDGILRRSIVSKDRSLRYDEALSICRFLGKNPFELDLLDEISALSKKMEEICETSRTTPTA